MKRYLKRLVSIMLAASMAFAFVSVAFADANTDLSTKEYSATVMKIGFTTNAFLCRGADSNTLWAGIDEENDYVTCEGMTSGAYQISFPVTADGVKMADRRQIDSGETDTHSIYHGVGTNPVLNDYSGRVHLRIEKPDSYPASANMTTHGFFSGKLFIRL